MWNDCLFLAPFIYMNNAVFTIGNLKWMRKKYEKEGHTQIYTQKHDNQELRDHIDDGICYVINKKWKAGTTLKNIDGAGDCTT